MELLPSVRFDVPLISIGNITVGGTGKTPMTEYLARLLAKDQHVAVLSRGYKRKSKGFYLANESSSVDDLGDESLQISKKLPGVLVAVDENRRRGITLLSDKQMTPPVAVILLDDAFQHRYVIPGISILLIDYNRLITRDILLPAGNLREPASQYKRAGMIVITKCPPDLKPIDRRLISMTLKLYSHQTLYYSTLDYGDLIPVLPRTISSEEPETALMTMEKILENRLPVLMVAGIASPAPYISYVQSYCPTVQTLLFSDHHKFRNKDIHHIQEAFEKIRQAGGVILTTEKDSVRMLGDSRFEGLLSYCYFPTLTIRFLDEEGVLFDKKILDYVRINKRNRLVDPATDAQ